MPQLTPQLDSLISLDLSAQIAQIPLHAGHSVLPPRGPEQYITLHYSGVDYSDRSPAAERARILEEARYQINHDYGTPGNPAFPDGLLYDIVVLSEGIAVLTRRKRVQLWHCGNVAGNKLSWAVHLMLGPNQDATDAQWTMTTRVFDALMVDCSIARVNVIGHGEWPRKTGLPQPSTAYRVLPGQSECPGRVLHGRLAAWRSSTPPIPAASDIWALWGSRYALPVEARNNGIPAFWKSNTWLGEARSEETFPGAGDVSVCVFQSGYIVYEKATGHCTVQHLESRLP